MRTSLAARRHLLIGLALIGLAPKSWAADAPAATAATATATATAEKRLPAYAAWKDPQALIVHSSSTLELKRSYFGAGLITPSRHLYVRNNLPAPKADLLDNREAWSLSVEGVTAPRVLTVRELKAFGVETVPMVLQCSGNGRGFFPSKPAGTPWTVGAAGCVVWTGVPLRTVIEALGGAVSGAAYITATGGEVLPAGIDPMTIVVERSIPIQALGDALLAWEMNGEPITLAHGGPLRLIVPGYQGVNHIKYIKRLTLTASETGARIMAHGYRVSPPGTESNASQPSVLEINVKSWITTPLPESGPLRANDPVQIQGVAFSGPQPVKRVEVSVDGGRNWRDARFVGPDLGKFAWRQFALGVQLPAGTHQLVSRATDAGGQMQPPQRLENIAGYNNNSWMDHGLSVVAA